VLIVFGGLPGTGKSAISSEVAEELAAVYLRIDTIEQSLRDAGLVKDDIGPAGYVVGYNVALDNLRLGLTVISDSVNPLKITRDAWRQVADRARVPVIEVEVTCSDIQEHRKRVETRVAEVEGLKLPSWDDVINRAYEPWDREHIAINTAGNSVEASIQQAIRQIANSGS
jgi:predicted kinase